MSASFQRSVKSDQRLVRMHSLILTGTGTAAVSGTSSTAVTLVDNGTGDWTLTFATPFGRAPEVMVTCVTQDKTAAVTACSTTAVTIKAKTVGTSPAAADAVMHVLIIGSDADAI